MLALNQPIPLPALPTITTRVATMDDLPFVDALQKKHSKQLGFFPRAQIEGYLKNGWMRIAEEVASCELRVTREDGSHAASLATGNSELATPRPVGYIASRDRYLKRDELGAVFQLCVEPGRQRGLIGATLLKSAFDASAYGCRLFCCWCAQDLAANHFWEAMGFSPIAFRAGSEKKQRIHIFWQKRIRAGDTTTAWWFPSETMGGSLREGRLVLPIPPGTHWRDVMPMVLPGQSTERALPSPTPTPTPRVREKKVEKATPMSRQFGPPPLVNPSAPIVPAPIVKVAKPKAEKRKNDPKLIGAARKLRDRWLEQVNERPTLSVGKYDVARQIAARGNETGSTVEMIDVTPTKLLAA